MRLIDADELINNLAKAIPYIIDDAVTDAYVEGLGRAKIEIEDMPTIEPEWNNHTVACLLADMFDDPCACNYNDIDEWLPEKCEVIDACPNPVGVACWEQFLTHRKERG